jgi:hypothetical protein
LSSWAAEEDNTCIVNLPILAYNFFVIAYGAGCIEPKCTGQSWATDVSPFSCKPSGSALCDFKNLLFSHARSPPKIMQMPMQPMLAFYLESHADFFSLKAQIVSKYHSITPTKS